MIIVFMFFLIMEFMSMIVDLIFKVFFFVMLYNVFFVVIDWLVDLIVIDFF